MNEKQTAKLKRWILANMMVQKDPRVHELLDFINKWARDRERKECRDGNYITSYGEGYHRACSDIYDEVVKTFKEKES